MSQNELFATAAHLHVLLRRKTGRVTDTEWMSINAQYAGAIVQFAREKAQSDGHTDLLPLAQRLETLVAHMPDSGRKPPIDTMVLHQRHDLEPDSNPENDSRSAAREDLSTRYIGRLR